MVKSMVCEDQAQEKNVGTKDERRIEDDLRENVCVAKDQVRREN